MARIRSIKQGFFQSEQLSALDAETHILAGGLLVYADDEGYFNANPKLVESFVFPLRMISRPINEMLDDLAKTGYIRLGECANGRTYGHIIKFLDHQRVSHAKPSEIKNMAITWRNSGEIPERLQKSSVLNRTELNRTEQNRKNPSAKNAECDPRHTEVREFIKHCITHATKLPTAPWDGRDAKTLKRVLDANPSWSVETFKDLVRNRFRSDEPRGDPPWKWLPELAKYANGPLDRFGKLKGVTDGRPQETKQSYIEQRINTAFGCDGATEKTDG